MGRFNGAYYNSIKAHGYDYSAGGVGVTILKRGEAEDYRYLLGGGGYHRAVAMKCAGLETLVASFHRASIVDVKDVDKWPGVVNGLWSPAQAVAYVDHLFDFDSKAWAIGNIL